MSNATILTSFPSDYDGFPWVLERPVLLSQEAAEHSFRISLSFPSVPPPFFLHISEEKMLTTSCRDAEGWLITRCTTNPLQPPFGKHAPSTGAILFALCFSSYFSHSPGVNSLKRFGTFFFLGGCASESPFFMAGVLPPKRSRPAQVADVGPYLFRV